MRRSLLNVLVLALGAGLVVTTATPALAKAPKSDWRHEAPMTNPANRNDSVMAFDPSTGQTVMFGGRCAPSTNICGDTWIWNGTNWIQQFPAHSPYGSGRAGTLMAYDPITGDLILHGGTLIDPGSGTAINYGDTWRWTGTDWVVVPTAHFPPIRSSAGMAYDPNLGQLILFGGATPSGWLNDTWTFTGTDWQQLTPAHSPTPRSDFGMATDTNNGSVILYGGNSSAGTFDQTWRWNGTDWTQLAPASTPNTAFDAAMTTDVATGAPAVFGGSPDGGHRSDKLWEWSGTNWVLQAMAISPGVRSGPVLAYNAQTGRLVAFGGTPYAISAGTWTFGATYQGLSWNVESPATSPSARNYPTMAYDRATSQLVLFGGQSTSNTALSDTYLWNGNNWTNANPATTPPIRWDSVMGFDERTNQQIMFGGGNGTSELSDTWKWNGTNWQQLSPATVPAAREGSAMTFDEAKNQLLMFGGRGGAITWYNDTWRWSGSNWVSVPTTTSPSPRGGAALAFDPSTGQTILYGGYDGTNRLGDTWQYDGTTWTKLSPPVSPGPRADATLAYDASLGDLVLFGGFTGSALPNSTYRWTGTTWEQLPASGPGGRYGSAVAYSPANRNLLLFGGTNGTTTKYATTATGVVTAETTPPAITVAHTANGTNGYNKTTPVAINITASDAQSGLAGPPTCTDNGGALGVSGSAPNFTASISAQGNHAIVCTATDNEGNAAQASDTVKVDSALPTVTVTNETNLNGPFGITFSEPVSIPSSNAVTVFEETNATNTPGSLTCQSGFDAQNRCVTWSFQPDDDLVPGEIYNFSFQSQVADDFADVAGNQLPTTFKQARAGLTVQQTDPEVSFGWGAQKINGTFGKSVTRERWGGATASYRFKGKSLTWYTVKGPDQGTAHVTITDPNNPVDTTVNNYAVAVQKKAKVGFHGLSGGSHTITITVNAALGDPAGSDVWVSLDAFKVGKAAVTNTPDATYAWTDIYSDYTFSDQPGASASMTFRGTGITWSALYGPNNGQVRVFIDGTAVQDVDLYDPNYNWGVASFNGLSDEQHTIQIVGLRTKNAASSDTIVNLDSFTVQ